ncbi:peptide deformylase [Candidatus Berkelbacteria bacterium]|nr:peptide deformylase [Candidatus Berkelbacteria bacterium]
MLIDILTYPNPILTTPAKKVPRVDSKIQALVQDMIETMRANKGVGLAAPQVGRALRLIVIEYQPDQDDPKAVAIPLQVLINPKILSKDNGVENAIEGCLSLPNIEVSVPRFKKIKVRATNFDSKIIQFRARDFHARILQHELDHLDGKLIIDYQ